MCGRNILTERLIYILADRISGGVGIEMGMKIKVLKETFAMCKVEDYSQVDLTGEFIFTGRTDEENSLVCPEGMVPGNASAVDRGWRGFRIEGVLDFSLIGILSKISGILADNGIGIFAISTFNTDYILTRSENLDKAVKALAEEGYEIF